MIANDPELSIGLLAHNEESRIGNTLQSLFTQDVFQKTSTEVVIVANGCSDETAAVARQLLAQHRAVWSVRGSARVVELVIGGKANAWNHFVHQCSSPFAQMLALMDADITFQRANTISSMVSMLQKTTEAVVCVDWPVKDIETKPNRSFFERLLLSATPKLDPENVPLCGHLYCAISASLREIKLPIEITMEDGFLRALLLTQGFTTPENRQRIVLAPDAAHQFTSVATLRELFNHERWVIAGSIVNALLFERFSAEAGASRNAMLLMKEWLDCDPKWLPHYIELQVRRRGWHLLPAENWTKRWVRLRGLPTSSLMRQLPIAAIAAALDLLIFLAAIRDVRSGRAYGYWGRK